VSQIIYLIHLLELIWRRGMRLSLSFFLSLSIYEAPEIMNLSYIRELQAFDRIFRASYRLVQKMRREDNAVHRLLSPFCPSCRQSFLFPPLLLSITASLLVLSSPTTNTLCLSYFTILTAGTVRQVKDCEYESETRLWLTRCSIIKDHFPELIIEIL